MDSGNRIDTLCNTGDGVYIVDEDKRIVRWNKAAETLLQYSASEVLDRQCHRILSGKTCSDTPHCGPDCRIHSAAASTPQKNFDIWTRTKAGDKIWLNISIISFSANGRQFLAHILRDVSKGKRMESALNRLLEELDGQGQPPDIKPDTDRPFPARSEQSPSGTAKASGLLSGREIEVLTLLAEGLPTKSLAQKLNISHFTARNHIQNVLVKLDLHSKAQAVAYAYKNGII